MHAMHIFVTDCTYLCNNFEFLTITNEHVVWYRIIPFDLGLATCKTIQYSRMIYTVFTCTVHCTHTHTHTHTQIRLVVRRRKTMKMLMSTMG